MVWKSDILFLAEASGKVHSVEELEARMRPKPSDLGGAMPPVREPRLADPAIASVVHHGGLPSGPQSKEEEVAAFKKLVSFPGVYSLGLSLS